MRLQIAYATLLFVKNANVSMVCASGVYKKGLLLLGRNSPQLSLLCLAITCYT